MVMVLALRRGVPGSNPVQILYFCMHLLIRFLLRTLGARPGLAKEPLIPFNVQKMDFLPNRFSVINDDYNRGCVTGNHSFKYGCFPV